MLALRNVDLKMTMNSPESDQSNPLNITGEQRPTVPTFACLIYVSKTDEGKVKARVANLSGFELTAATERDALLRISKQFKAHVVQETADGEAIDWIEPPLPAEQGEVVRSIPVHL